MRPSFITSITPRHKARLLELYTRNFPLSPWNQRYLDAFLSGKKRSTIFYAIKEKDDFIGLILGRSSKTDPEIMILSVLAVDPHHQRKGYGSMLIEKFLSSVKKNPRIKKVFVHFRQCNDLENFYSRAGFKNHSISGSYSNGEKKHQMEFHLK
jgi:ribosomal protein S18 acetylase RimI-like enzyme